MFESLVLSLVPQIVAIILGASIGSFLNVVIYRIPAGLSILYPPSRCPKCLKKLSPFDNIPIIGWFLIKGKCRYCHSKVSGRYPFIEALTALAFWLIFISNSTSIHPWLFTWVFIAGNCIFLSYLIALGVIDINTMTLPNPLTQSGLVLGVIFNLSLAISTNSFGKALTVSILGAVLGIWLVDIVRMLGYWLMQKEAMGAGDAKLAAMIGAWLGWQQLVITIFIASILGTIIGGLILKNSRKTQPIPFGPFLAIAATICVFYGNQILNNYLNWFGIY